MFQIGWIDKICPHSMPVTAQQVIDSYAIRKATKHLAIEIGGRKAQSHRYRLARLLKRIERLLSDGMYLQIHTTNQGTAPEPWSRFHGLGIEVRCIRDNKVIWDIRLFSNPAFRNGIEYNLESDPKFLYRSVSRVDVLLRKIYKNKEERNA